jgi:hypothetical protein
MSEPKAPLYLVSWPCGTVGGFVREDILLITIAENRSDGAPLGIWKLNNAGWSITYEPITVEELRAIAFPKPDIRPLDSAAYVAPIERNV